MTRSATEEIGNFIARSSYSDLSGEVVRKAKFRLLDSFGCGFGGARSALGQTAANALSGLSEGNATVFGFRQKMSAGTSAFLNAALINALDFDESSPAGHLSSTLVGTLLSMTGQTQASGRHLILSYVTGYEVGARVAAAAQPSAERFAQVWGLGTHQTFGAVAAAAKLSKLNRLQTLNALGIAGASAPVPSAQKWGWDDRPLSWVKDAVAMPAQAGVLSAALAQAGFLGCRDILDGPHGFWRMASSDRCDFDLLTRGLGSEFRILQASIKMYSCCWMIHPTLDAIDSFIRRYGLEPEDIAQVDVWSMTDISKLFNVVEPKNLVDAQFSLPYCAAMVILGIPPGPKWFDEDLFRDETVLSVGSRVKAHADSRFDHIFHNDNRRISARVAVTTTGGVRYEETVAAPQDTSMFPVSEDAIIEKYLGMAIPVIGSDNARRLKDFILQLEVHRSVRGLSDLVSTW